ncbi:MAG: adenylate/guanylate cyclase domain-containing protein [Treponema sp.]|nr:adenylate/guanylate cyclase domain-containing protein [Treponema sp.]
MPYNIEFQIAGFSIVSILTIVFFSKPRWQSLQNSIFRVLMPFTLLELLFDIVSTITIAERDFISRINTFFAKGYIVVMILWIAGTMLYIMSNFIYDDMPKKSLTAIKISFLFIIVPAIACCIITFCTPLYYANYGREIYSYGTPSTCTYIFSVYCVIFAIAGFLLNFRHLTFKRKVPMFAFTVMEGAIALIQMAFPKLLLLGFGTALVIFIMYMTMENPDMDMIAKLNDANKRASDLLLNILPVAIAAKLEENTSSFTEKFDNVTVAFIDIVDFTKMSQDVGGEKLVKLLNSLFTEIDTLLDNYKIEKIKTIGDAYMIAAGLPERYDYNCEEMMRFLIDVQKTIASFNKRNNTALQIRTGVNSGEVIAGIIGKKKFIYDLWGNTVNLASRMEMYGVPNYIQVSQNVYEMLKDSYAFNRRGNIDIKGIGKTTCYLLKASNT